MMIWAAKNGRFVFHKDTSLSVDLMLNKLKAVQSVPGTQLKYVFTDPTFDLVGGLLIISFF